MHLITAGVESRGSLSLHLRVKAWDSPQVEYLLFTCARSDALEAVCVLYGLELLGPF